MSMKLAWLPTNTYVPLGSSFSSPSARTRMKLTARSDFAQSRAMECCRLPVRSKKEAHSERVPIATVESTIRGVENSRDRSRLIASPQS